MIGDETDDFEPVPTPKDLARLGLATPLSTNKQGEATVFHVTPAGHDAMNGPQTRNGLRARARNEARTNPH